MSMNRFGYQPLFKMKKEKYRIAVYHTSCYNRCSYCLKWAAALVLFVLQAGFCVSLDLINEGKKLLLSNNPDKALVVFHQAEAEGAVDPVLDLYLGVAYLRTGQYADAELRLSSGKEKDTARSYLYSYNLGNCYYMQNRFAEAENEYSYALQMRHTYPPAVLNRANTRVQLQKYTDAVQDYKYYLAVEPATPQAAAIQQMIRVLEQPLESISAQAGAAGAGGAFNGAAGAAAGAGTAAAGNGHTTPVTGAAGAGGAFNGAAGAAAGAGTAAAGNAHTMPVTGAAGAGGASHGAAGAAAGAGTAAAGNAHTTPVTGAAGAGGAFNGAAGAAAGAGTAA
ncbi:MAG: tetratricopeptide repeat protein, partial [Treponema sp.]